jgi:hypothetical protein
MLITNNTIRHSAKYFLLSLGLTLVACGGGGGGSSYPSIQYTGETNQATVDETNADEFPVTILEGSTSSSQSNPYAVVTNGDSTKSAQHTAMLNILTEQIKNDILNNTNKSDNSVVSAATQTANGTCPINPGSLTVTDNSTQSSLNASFTYDNLCIGDFNATGLEVSLHGKIDITGSIDANAQIIYNFTMSIPYMKMTVRSTRGTFSEEFSGSIAVTFDGTTNNLVTGMTMSTNFQSNGLTFKIENLVVDTSGGTFAISGRFYHPLYGYVDVTTTEPFDLYTTTNSPDRYCSGTMQITGNGGVIDFTSDANCSTYDLCFTPTGGSQTCTTANAWPQ